MRLSQVVVSANSLLLTLLVELQEGNLGHKNP